MSYFANYENTLYLNINDVKKQLLKMCLSLLVIFLKIFTYNIQIMPFFKALIISSKTPDHFQSVSKPGLPWVKGAGGKGSHFIDKIR